MVLRAYSRGEGGTPAEFEAARPALTWRPVFAINVRSASSWPSPFPA